MSTACDERKTVWWRTCRCPITKSNIDGLDYILHALDCHYRDPFTKGGITRA